MNLNPLNLFKRNPVNAADFAEMLKFYTRNAGLLVGDVNISGDNILTYSAMFGCVRVLGETFASVPVFEYKRDITTGNRERTNDTGVFDILHNAPNDMMSAFNFNETGMYQLNLGGNFVARRIKNSVGKGDLIGLTPYQWSRVDIEQDERTGKIKYIISTPGKTEKITLAREEVFHVPGPSLNGVWGLTPIEYAAGAARLGVTYEQFSTKFFKNGALSSGMFRHPGTLGDKAWKRLKKDLQKNYQGLINAGNAMMLEDGLDFKEITMKLQDAELLTSKKFQVEEICRFYRVPLHLVQSLDRATNNNIEHQSLEFAMYTMLPWFKRWEGAINQQLLTRDQRDAGYFFEYNMAALLRGDSKSTAEAFASGRQWGWLSVNDIRRLLNMNSIGPAGDIYLQPINMRDASKEEITDQFQNLVNEIQLLIESRKG